MSLTEIRRKIEKALRLWENRVCVWGGGWWLCVCVAVCVCVCVGVAVCVCVPTRITVTPGSLAATLPSRLL